MASIEKIVQDILEVLSDSQSSDELDVGVISHLANEYEEAFLQMAEKANRCLELLHEGSLRQASKLAKQDPDLRSQFGWIDFDERLDWLKLCENFKIQCNNVSTDNINSCAGIIERVYKNTDNLTELLRVHRRLALNRAPLSERLHVLRLIAQEDQMNSFWTEDVRLYEKEYLDELAKQTQKAVHDRDLKVLERISKELHTDNWRVQVPSKFVKTVDRYVLDNRQRHANAQLKRIGEKIHQAHAAMDEQACQGHYDDWNQVLEQFGVEPPMELHEQIQPAVEWLTELREARDQNKAFANACAKLELLIDEQSKADDLEKQAAKVLSFEQGMPELLAARFTSKMDTLKLKRKRTFTVTIAAVVGILLIIAAGMTVIFIRLDEGRQLTRWQQQIAAAIKSNSLETAGKLLSQVKNDEPDIFNTPEIRQLDGEYHEKYKQENDRKLAFEQMLNSFKKGGAEAINPAMLEKAEQMAKGPDEESEVFQWRTQYDDWARTKQQQRDQAFEAQLNQLEKEYSKYHAMDPLERNGFRSEVRECLFKAEGLVNAEGVSVGLLSRARLFQGDIRNDLQKTNDVTSKKEKIEKALARLSKPYKNTMELSTDLQEFVDAHQDQEVSSGMFKTLNFKKEWAAVDTWNSLVQSWRPKLLTGDLEVIQQRLDQIDNYMKSHPSSPCRNQLHAYKDYLDLAKVKLVSWKPKGLRDVLRSPLMSELLIVESNNGESYYMLENTFTEFQGDKYRFKYISDSSLKEESKVLSKDSINPKEIKPSPQSVFSKAAQEKLSDMNSDGWETILLDLALKCAQDKEMDCILRANLVKLFLQSAKNVVPYKTELIEAILTDLDEDKIDKNWIDPTNQNANQVRPEVTKIVNASRTSIEKTIQEIKAQLLTIQKTLGSITLAGIVLGDGNHVIIHSDQSVRNGKAMVISILDDNKAVDKMPVFVEIGRIVDYQFLGSPTNVSQGTPVFVRPD